MTRSKRPDILLELALRALERVPRFLESCTQDDYLRDELRQAAVERQLEIAGEALGQLRKLDAVLFARIPQGDVIVAFRNVLAHGYGTLNHRLVYEIAATRVEALRAALGTLLSEY